MLESPYVAFVAAALRNVSVCFRRQSDVQARLDAKRAALVAQYTVMESALSKIQSQATYLTQQINSITSLQSSK